MSNVVPVLGTLADPRLPPTLDLIIIFDVYHEFDHPYEMMQGIGRFLKPGGRVVLVEYRSEEWVPIKPLHKMTEARWKVGWRFTPLDWSRNPQRCFRQPSWCSRRQAGERTRREGLVPCFPKPKAERDSSGPQQRQSHLGSGTELAESEGRPAPAFPVGCPQAGQ